MGMTKTVNIVDGATSGAKGIVQHMVRLAINVVRKTILELYADPVGDPRKIVIQEGQIGSKETDVCTSVMCMKFAEMTVIMMTTQYRI